MYTLRPIFKMLLLFIPAVGGLLFAFNLLRQKQSWQVREGIRRCIRRLPLILAVSFVSGVCCLLYLRTGEPYSGSFKMGYTYPKASKGLTPNSTSLDVSEVFCNEVLEKVVQTGFFGSLTPEEIKNTLSIRNVRQRNNVSMDALYVSTEYVVGYNASERTASLDKNMLLKAVADSYYEYFVTKYSRKTDVLEADYAQALEMDYLDINTYLSRQARVITEYMDMCKSENSTFASEVTGESFASIKDKVRNFQDVSLERYKAYVLKYGISKDREQYVSRLNYENRLENVKYMKNLAAYSVRLAAIERYEGDITRAVLVPTRDESGEFYQSRTKIGTDYFAADADMYLQYATSNQLNIETNNYYIESLSTAAGGKTHTQKADEMVASLIEEITSISRQAVETVRDFDTQTSNGYVSFVFQGQGGKFYPYIKKTMLYSIGLAGVWLAVIFTGTDLNMRLWVGRKLQKIQRDQKEEER